MTSKSLTEQISLLVYIFNNPYIPVGTNKRDIFYELYIHDGTNKRDIFYELYITDGSNKRDLL